MSKIPNKDFHEIWWVYSPIKNVSWAGLRIAHFRKMQDGTTIFFLADSEIGPRIWVDAFVRERWFKVRQIPIPTTVDVMQASLEKDGHVKRIAKRIWTR